MSGVTLRQVVKRYGETQVIHGVDLDIAHGDFCVFVGPSGCGKSTLLRMVAGLEETTEGHIRIGDRDVTRLDPSERGLAMVFQSYALYPHMTVAENMGFGLRMNGAPKAEIAKRVAEAAEILRLEPFLQRRPQALSGGQRQRVAIGRAIVRAPDVFLFDEPLSNLDAELRVAMRIEIAKLHRELEGATMIYVTHDQTEAMTLADQIVVLRLGRVEQVGAPLELYRNPANRFVAGFIGSPQMNFLDARVTRAGEDGVTVALAPPEAAADASAPRLSLPLGAGRLRDGDACVVGVRPEHVLLGDRADPGAGLDVAVDLVEHLGGVSYVYAAAPGGGAVTIETRDDADLRLGAPVRAHIPAARAFLFDQDGDRVR